MMATSCEEMQLPRVKQLAGKLSVEKKSIPVLAVSLAGTEEEVLQCQRLRYNIFAEEMGAILDTTIPGIDQDTFDSLCKHLVVRDIRSGDIVGTTRAFLLGN
jgi:putative hemolysin